uniref:MD-2-related lipid-recognition domain-containing protein n=1 Tax=Sipha flava TaxID=143950 RepID=A0A2S2QTX6_9HEMI
MILFWIILGLLSLSESQKSFLPNLPAGEYRIVYDAVYNCKYSKNNLVEVNLYFSKKSNNMTEVKGNFTLHIPVDDDLNLEVNFSSWSLRGGWVKNSFVQNFDKMCTNLKMLAGKAWSPFVEAFHVPTNKCPIPKGTYTTKGIDVRVVDGNNFPKVFFYGKYKLEMKIKFKNNTLVGCEALEIRVVRPWELPNF